MINKSKMTLNRTSLNQAIIRENRKKYCFPIVNRGTLWYNTLTETQKQELNEWYVAYLNAPQTGVEPTAPSWLAKEIENAL